MRAETLQSASADRPYRLHSSRPHCTICYDACPLCQGQCQEQGLCEGSAGGQLALRRTLQNRLSAHRHTRAYRSTSATEVPGRPSSRAAATAAATPAFTAACSAAPARSHTQLAEAARHTAMPSQGQGNTSRAAQPRPPLVTMHRPATAWVDPSHNCLFGHQRVAASQATEQAGLTAAASTAAPGCGAAVR